MNSKKVLDLLSKMKGHIADIETHLLNSSESENSNVFKSKKHDNYCTWFMKIKGNTFESMRSSLSRINTVENNLKVDLTKLPLQKFDSLIERITVDTFPKNAFRTVNHFKGAVRNYYKFRTEAREK